MTALRNKIDEADRELLAILQRRFELCYEVAAIKGDVRTQVLQPDRVRDVLRTRVAWARERQIDPEFAELLFRSLLSETHRIEAVHLRSAAGHDGPDRVAPDTGQPEAPYVDSALQATACRVDHVTVAVDDLDEAIRFFVDNLGFRVRSAKGSHPDHPGLDSAVVDAGGVTFVLMRAAAEHPGEPLRTGVHHIALEVLNAGFVRNALEAAGCPLQTDVQVTDNGLERFFTVRDASSGLQLGFVSRVGERANFDGGDVQALSAAIEDVG
jgi:chorismate mutase/catechol 2,3-dioxygenase-like lactoylglutathione lyase family enzyme